MYARGSPLVCWYTLGFVNDLHPDIAPLGFLVGEWTGDGTGHYPTIEPFAYDETVVFAHVGKPFLAYTQRTRRRGDHPEAGLPLHAETGYLRHGVDGVELVIAQPSGITEIQVGWIEGTTLHFRSHHVGLTPSAKEVVAVERRIVVEGDRLTYDLWMTAVGQVHRHHLNATLLRSG